MESWHDPVPEQAPVQPAKVEPVFATAVSCTGVPMLKPAVQVVPQLIPVGLLVTVPIPVPVSATVRVAPLRSKPAVTDSTEFISTWHDPVPEQAPVQPVNVESGVCHGGQLDRCSTTETCQAGRAAVDARRNTGYRPPARAG